MIQIVTESPERDVESNRRSTAEAAVWTAIFSIRRESPVSIATGYFKNHSTEEYLHLDDFYHAGELVARIIGRIA